MSVEFAYWVVAVPAAALAAALVWLYRPRAGALPRALDAWSVSVEELGGFGYGKLALVSAFTLFLELLIIRWVSSEIRVFAYLKNFVLIACYLGFGLGCFLGRRRIHPVAMILPPMYLALLTGWRSATLRDLLEWLPALLGESAEVHVWGVPTLPQTWEATLRLAQVVAFTAVLFLLLTMMFVPVGQMVGRLLETAPDGIGAYTVNVAASLGGILGYAALCRAALPPWVWFTAAGAMAAAWLWRKPRAATLGAAGFAACALVTAWPLPKGFYEYWSPYQKLMLIEYRSDDGELLTYNLLTNNSWYQHIVNLSDEFVRRHREVFERNPIELNPYNLPYTLYDGERPPRSVLVLGAGMGNDVAAALRAGAERVVAVEIDPTIIDLGRRFHFERPYDSPRVQIVIDDARAYLQHARETFDVVVFSLLDSHTTASHYTNIRLDNYVYTREAFAAAKRLLAPSGLFIVKFQAETPWLAGRLNALMRDAFGRDPVPLAAFQGPFSTGGYFFIDGARERIDRAAADDPRVAEFLREHGRFPMAEAVLTTDDWPYFYQHAPGLPAAILTVSAVLIALGAAAMRTLGARGVRRHGAFFFLGAGFMLLEVQIVSKAALLFGTTWMVNAIVIAGLLLLIVLANLLVRARPALPTRWAWGGLMAALALGGAVPVQALLVESFAGRAAAAGAIYGLPVFFAGIVFIRLFAAVRFDARALGANLLGALAGGLMESLSLWTGLRSLMALAALLYGAAWLSAREDQGGPPSSGRRASK